MKPKSSNLPLKRVVLWPEAKVYNLQGTIQQTQRVPFCKSAILSKVGNASIYFEGEPIILN